MNKQEAVECIKALKLVKERIKQGLCYYICVDLERLAEWGYISPFTECTIKKYINRQLGNYSSLDSWLSFNHGISSNINPDDFYQKIRQTRLNWIDYMIEQYKKIK